ncbi:hypothetical protein [Psychrobacillus sp. FSL K6-1267]
MMKGKIQDIDRIAMIDLLVIMTGKGEAYFLGMTEDQLLEEYDRLME